MGWFSSISGNPDTLNDHVCPGAKLSVPSEFSPNKVSWLSKNCTLTVIVCNVLIVSLFDTLPTTSYEFMVKFLNTLTFDTCRFSNPPFCSETPGIVIALEESHPSVVETEPEPEPIA